jgi:hypothetical protein
VTVVKATNVNRTYAAKGQSLAAPFSSDIIDFMDMPMGSIQLDWLGAVGTGGSFKIFASNLPRDDAFDKNEIDCSEMLIDAAAGAPIWIRDRLAFRYAQVRYTPNGTTGGTVDILALGKKT